MNSTTPHTPTHPAPSIPAPPTPSTHFIDGGLGSLPPGYSLFVVHGCTSVLLLIVAVAQLTTAVLYGSQGYKIRFHFFMLMIAVLNISLGVAALFNGHYTLIRALLNAPSLFILAAGWLYLYWFVRMADETLTHGDPNRRKPVQCPAVVYTVAWLFLVLVFVASTVLSHPWTKNRSIHFQPIIVYQCVLVGNEVWVVSSLFYVARKILQRIHHALKFLQATPSNPSTWLLYRHSTTPSTPTTPGTPSGTTFAAANSPQPENIILRPDTPADDLTNDEASTYSASTELASVDEMVNSATVRYKKNRTKLRTFSFLLVVLLPFMMSSEAFIIYGLSKHLRRDATPVDADSAYPFAWTDIAVAGTQWYYVGVVLYVAWLPMPWLPSCISRHSGTSTVPERRRKWLGV
eukprot:TRINITY_DN23621_c0_g1_i1.p1 TRINITY_DN23621_c0_g1~~TRINITY_DN23621_c0_g1_i1.p1  ORF type:complete len:404 (-),score=28.86 TRINITY_DN23621_c0_g1_i1:1447-2658(-)